MCGRAVAGHAAAVRLDGDEEQVGGADHRVVGGAVQVSGGEDAAVAPPRDELRACPAAPRWTGEPEGIGPERDGAEVGEAHIAAESLDAQLSDTGHRRK